MTATSLPKRILVDKHISKSSSMCCFYPNYNHSPQIKTKSQWLTITRVYMWNYLRVVFIWERLSLGTILPEIKDLRTGLATLPHAPSLLHCSRQTTKWALEKNQSNKGVPCTEKAENQRWAVSKWCRDMIISTWSTTESGNGRSGVLNNLGQSFDLLL